MSGSWKTEEYALISTSTRNSSFRDINHSYVTDNISHNLDCCLWDVSRVNRTICSAVEG